MHVILLIRILILNKYIYKKDNAFLSINLKIFLTIYKHIYMYVCNILY